MIVCAVKHEANLLSRNNAALISTFMRLHNGQHLIHFSAYTHYEFMQTDTITYLIVTLFWLFLWSYFLYVDFQP